MLDVKPVILYTDVVLWALLAVVLLYVWHVRREPGLAAKWRRVLADRTAVASGALLCVFFLVALADSLHWRAALPGADASGAVVYDTRTVSLLDAVVGSRIAGRERSYSAPFALREFDKTTVIENGVPVRDFQRLTGAGAGWAEDEARARLARRGALGLLCGLAAAGGFLAACGLIGALGRRKSADEKPNGRAGLLDGMKRTLSRANPWRPALLVWACVLLAAVLLAFVWPERHVLGTDTTGNDVLYSALKSIRTAVAIGSLATLSTLPFAVTLGIAAGYFRGWVDDLVQYVYTTISSIPSVLLIAASVLMIQVFIDKNPALYETGLERADMRLFSLACIIGLTGWASLARLLRAETMKTAAADYVSAARAFGVPAGGIMLRHILPNVAHVVLIVAVLDFSGIVLYEAVLSYVGVGVDPVMESFGSMINAAAAEMSRSPVIWWNLLASLAFMLALVLSANLFASGVRDAFDPRAARRAG